MRRHATATSHASAPPAALVALAVLALSALALSLGVLALAGSAAAPPTALDARDGHAPHAGVQGRTLAAGHLAARLAPSRPLAPRFVRVGQPDAPPPGARLQGRTPGSVPLDLELALRPRDAPGIAALAAAVSNPASPDYHHYLSAGAFAARFGPRSSEVTAVQRWLATHGLHPEGLAPDGLAVRVHATGAAVERAFATRLDAYRLPDGARFLAASAAPLVPATLAPAIAGVLGLGAPGLHPAGLHPAGLHPAGLHPAGLPVGAAAGAPASAARRAVPAASPTPACQVALSGADAGFGLDQLASWYGYDAAYRAGDIGAGASVGLIEFAPYVASDLTSFEQCYGGATPQVSTVTVDGGPGSSFTSESAVETDLDLELVAGLAPAARITLYEGNLSSTAGYDAFAAAVSADAVSVLSSSWGACEPEVGRAEITAEGLLFEQAALQGQTVLAASGDAGSEDCYGSAPGPAAKALEVDDPASQPYVTGVGGTSLQLGGAAGPSGASGALSGGSETAWNTTTSSANPGAGGGGLSTVWPMPAYQRGAAPSLGLVGPSSACAPAGPGGDCREVPDVSADAGSPIAIYCSVDVPKLCNPGGWTPLDGTSASAPIWAALFALADASTACTASGASGAVGFANPALYAAAGGLFGTGYGAAFHDVVTGDNDLTGTNGGRYAAGPGYDLASGLGTPIAGSGSDGGLIALLCSPGAHAHELAGLPAPQVTKVSPRTVRSRGGAHVVLVGFGFTGATVVRFGHRRARSFRIVSPTRIVVVAPPGHAGVHVSVTASGGTSARTSADLLDYLTPPVLLSLTPTAGPASGGTVVTIRGRWLTGVRSVRFGASPASAVTVRSAGELVATAPRGTGTVPVSVVTRGGRSAERQAASFTYRP